VIGRPLMVVATLLAGHAVFAALYVALLNVSEATAWLLAVSAALVVLIGLVLLWTHVAAALLWLPAGTWRAAVTTAPRRLHWGALAAGVFGLAWVATLWLAGWHAASRGTIDAALMAQFNWAEPASLHQALAALIFVLRYGVGLSLALAALAAGLIGGNRAVASPAWARRALHPFTWLLLAVIVFAFGVLPWQYAYWRPGWVRGGWTELAFVGAKLGSIAMLMAIGWALALWLAMRRQLAPVRMGSSRGARL
jgi:hypothetical protein